jgi:hypothetical protein
MGRPVIVDDGGSIQITWKQNRPIGRAAGKMDGLLDVRENDVNPPRKWISECEVHDPGQPYSQASIAWVREDRASGTQQLNQFQRILVSTDLSQNVEVTMVQGGKLNIMLYSHDVEPIIESKYINKKRSYAVINGGRINRIEYDDQNGVNQEFIFPGPTVYMSVVIT